MQPPSNIVDIYKKQGWNDIAAINADIAAGGWKSKVPNGGNTSSNSSSQPNISSAIDPAQATQNAIDSATKIRDFNIQSAQPQISTLNQSKSTLDDQYQKLLASVKGQQTTDVNNATKATNAQLTARGLSTQDPNAASNLAEATRTAAQPGENLIANIGMGQTQDENAIAAQIAALQSGNPTGAVSSGLQIGQLGQQAAQLGLQQNQQQFSQRYITIPGYGIYDTTNGSLLGGMSTTGVSPTGSQIIGSY